MAGKMDLLIEVSLRNAQAMERTNKQLTNINRNIKKMGRAAKKANTEGAQTTQKFSNKVQALSNRLGFVAFRWQFMGTIARNTLISIITPFLALFYATKDTGTQMARLTAFATDFGDEMEASLPKARALTDEVRRLGSGETRFGLQELALAATELTRAGLDAEQVTAALSDVVNILTVEEIGAEEAAIGLVVAMRAYNLEANDMTAITDTLVNVNNQSTATLQSLIRSMGYASAQASRMGFSMEETATILGVLTDRLGLVRKGSAGRYFAQFGAEMSRIYGPTVDVSKVIKQQSEQWGTLDNVQKEYVIKTLGLSRRALDTYLKLMEMAPGELDELTEASQQSGTAAELARRQHETFAYQLGRVSAAAFSLGTAFTESFVPAMTELADQFQLLAGEEGLIGMKDDIEALGSAISRKFTLVLKDGFGTLVTSVAKFKEMGITSNDLASALYRVVAALFAMFVITRVIGLFTAFGAALFTIANIFVGFGEAVAWVVAALIKAWPGIILWAKGLTIASVAMTALIVFIVAIVTVLVTLATYIIMAREESESWTEATSRLIGEMAGLPTGIREVLQVLTAAAGGVLIIVQEIYDGLVIFGMWIYNIGVMLGKGFEFIGEKVKEGIEWVKQKFEDFVAWLDGIATKITSALDIDIFPAAWADDGKTEMLSVQEMVKKFVDNIKNKIVELVDSAKIKITDLWNDIKDKTSGAVASVIAKVTEWKDDFIERISTAADAAWEKIAGWCGDVQQRFEDWRSDVMGKLQEWYSQAKRKITEFTSETWTKIQEWVTNVKDKFNSWKNDVIKKVTEFKDSLIDKITTAIEVTYARFTDFWDDIKSGFIGLVDDALDWGRNLLQNFIDGFWEKIPSLRSVIATIANIIAGPVKGESPPKEGPLKTIDEWGGNLMNELTTGIKDASPNISDMFSMKPYDTGALLGYKARTGTESGDYGRNGGGPTTITVEINIDKLADSVTSDVDIDDLLDRFSDRIKESFPTILMADR